MSAPRFVEIIRVSTQIQAGRDTPALQRAALERLRLKRPGRLVARIEALGVSGALTGAERPDLVRLSELTKAGAYDEIRCYDLDRLTRAEDPQERFAVWAMAASAGARIIDASGRELDPKTDTAGLGEVDFYLRTLFAAQERHRIAARTKAGCARKAAEGKLPRGIPPYGRVFDVAKGQWGLHREESAVYRRIFKLCLSGLSIRRICDRLNTEGVPTRRGGEWAWSTIGQLLRDRSAIGEWAAHGATMAVPPIVDRATFEAAHQRLEKNHWEGAGPRATRHPALLRKLLSCGTCGATMYVRSTGKWSGGRVFYYQCGTARDKRADDGCSKMHAVERVDAIVRGQVRAFLDDPTVLSSALDVDRSGEVLGELAEAKRELAQVEREETKLARLGRRGLISDRVMVQQVAEVAKLRAEAVARLGAAQASVNASKSAASMRGRTDARLSFLRRRIDQASLAEWRELVGMLFPRGPATGLVLYRDGRIEGRGTLDLGAGASNLPKNAHSKLSVASCSDGRIGVLPLALVTTSRR